MKRKILAALAALLLLCAACGDRGNRPYEPDTPAPAPHTGTFTSDHGSLRFDGDGETVEYAFDPELAALTGLPEGEHEGTYVFLSGDLPPNGSVPVRYDTAHELRITTGEDTAVIRLGLAAEDGKSATVGVNVVTPERIPLLFTAEGGSFSIVFVKGGTE
jgi:hypothetical protein